MKPSSLVDETTFVRHSHKINVIHPKISGEQDKGGGDCFQLPHAPEPDEVDDIDAILERVDLLLLRLLAPVEDAAREEEPLLEAPRRIDGVDRLDAGHLPDGELLPRGEAPGVELLLPDPGLGQDVGDDLLRGGVEEGVVDLRVLE